MTLGKEEVTGHRKRKYYIANFGEPVLEKAIVFRKAT
jgi:hypothetical protein